jgi:hypothetical protein
MIYLSLMLSIQEYDYDMYLSDLTKSAWNVPVAVVCGVEDDSLLTVAFIAIQTPQGSS